MNKNILSESIHSMKFIDLGLPSGTRWKDHNEDDFYTYDQAFSTFGEALPTVEQFNELKSCCQWEWTQNGYKVTGPNGNSIIMPAEGFRNSEGEPIGSSSCGFYWSSMHNGDKSSVLFIDSRSVDIGKNSRQNGSSVRLVKCETKETYRHEEDNKVEAISQIDKVQEKETISKARSGRYVNLGLPSGTRWKDHNEDDFYTYDQAFATFGEALPTVEQFNELESCCQWEWGWNKKGYFYYKVIGPNGKSIILPAKLKDHPHRQEGFYWLSQLDNDLECTIFGYIKPPRRLGFRFERGSVYLVRIPRDMRLPVRLVR